MKKLISLLLALAVAAALVPAASVFAAHNFKETARVEPTCTEDGYVEYACEGCDTITYPVKITGKSVLAASELLAYSEKQLANMRLTCTPAELIGYYLSIGDKYGIRGDIAYLQAVKETGWFKFNRPNTYLEKINGVWVRVEGPRPEGLYAVPTDNNFCGLGITGKLGDEDRLCRFATAQLGVTAHIQHLYAYATTAALPAGETLIDPRFSLVTRGSADTWVELGNDKWTNSPTYGESIVNSYVSALTNYAECYGNCDETKREMLPATGHDWTPWRVTSPATHKAKGEETRVCTKCMKRETRAVDAISEQWGDFDRDGSFTVIDALAVLRAAAGIMRYSGAEWILSDVDRDESITVTDALIVLRAAAKIEDVPQVDYAVGRAATLMKDKNETFFAEPSNSDTSLPQCFWLPGGTSDYIVSESAYSGNASIKYYTLRSGHRVYQADSSAAEKCILKNDLLAADLKVDGKYTYFTVAGSQKTPYSVVMNGLFSGGQSATTANCSNFTSVSVTFHGAFGAPAVSAAGGPLFSEASVSSDADKGTVTYTFKLKRKGMFCGYNSYYDADGNLVLRFHNPITVTDGRIDGTVICIDSGHGGNDSGASGNGLIEADENLKVAKLLRTMLQQLGATVYMTRESAMEFSDGTKITSSNKNSRRLEIIAACDPDLLISVHHNDFTDPSAHGTEALYFYGFNQALAQKVSDAISSVSGMRNRGGKYQNVFVYRNHDFMSFLIEAGFLSNKEDTAWLSADGNTEVLARSVVNALLEYFA